MAETPTINVKVALEGIEEATKRLEDEFGKGFVKVLGEVQAELKKTGGTFDSLVPDSVLKRLKAAGVLARDIPKAFEALKKAVADTAAIEAHIASVERAAAAWRQFRIVGGGLVTAIGAVATAFAAATAAAQKLTLQMATVAGAGDSSIEKFDQMRRAFIRAGGTTEEFMAVWGAMNRDLAKLKTDSAERLAATLERIKKTGRIDVADLPTAGRAIQTAATLFDQFALSVAKAKSEGDALRLVLEKYPQASAATVASIKAYGAALAAAQQQTAGLTKEQQDAAVAAEQAANRASEAWKNVSLRLGAMGIGTFFSDLSTQAALEVDKMITGAQRLGEAWRAASAQFGGETFLQFWSRMGTLATETIDGIISKVAELISWLDALARRLGLIGAPVQGGSVGGSGEGMPGGARGGMVRGPGTSTSDSILARLSTGEFVISARAVKHFGAQFFAALNALRAPGFAAGGLVDRLLPQVEVPRFARGGLVGAGPNGKDLGTLTLMAGGQALKVYAQADVVETLTRYATTTGQRRAGRPPSWSG